jgi:hypothetical protein
MSDADLQMFNRALEKTLAETVDRQAKVIAALREALAPAALALIAAANILDDHNYGDLERQCMDAHQGVCAALAAVHEQTAGEK